MKVFNEKETAEILKLAAQGSQKEIENQGPGLTQVELEDIAKDAGIDPSEITKAIKTIELNRESGDQSFWGGPFTFSEQVVIDHEITAVEWENMLVPIRAFFQSKGEVYSREAVHEWSSPRGTSNSAHITALKENRKTKVSINWNGPLTALPYYLPMPIVGIASLLFASGFLELGAVPGWSFVALSVGLTFVAGRKALRKQMKTGFAKLRDLAATLEGFSTAAKETGALETEHESTAELTPSAPEPLLTLDDEPNVTGSAARNALRTRE
ncbi:hypothetical protein HQ496_03805 [bacterium]|nr:hypothetical protein [bacterium]